MALSYKCLLYIFSFHAPVRRGKMNCGNDRHAAGPAAGPNAVQCALVIDPQTNQIKSTKRSHCGRQKNKSAFSPLRHKNKGTIPCLVKSGFGQLSLTYFQSFFVDAPAVLIFDPSSVSLDPLVPNNFKRANGIVGYGFDYPCRHGCTSHV